MLFAESADARGIKSRDAMITGLSLLLLMFSPLSFAAENAVDGFEPHTHKNASGKTMPYRLFVPPGYSGDKQYPLVIWLHGAGGAGRDNRAQISRDQVPGTRTWTKRQNQAKYPAFVLVPQSPGAWIERVDQISSQLLLVLEIVETVKTQFTIDPARIYVAGQSDGGYAAWNLITHRPDVFAAAIALCGGGDPRMASRIVNVPVWAFHGRRDDIIPVAESRNMVEAIRKAGGHPRYTEYERLGHDIWDRAFSEPEIVSWLFAQHR
jgi:predicted peptidase